ncbi:sporulation integral membrane protein YtvI [Paenibacillus pini]|uniref:Sporulation integral membrane protein YtvI n=1 Tax=Paenibacillus pini JCM 16418 TaxID=1236976 RepID=W7YNR5_9BACL|nr:sporulation integral membrane protein YtvI [Paenibacillus pini]GAF06301.1 hypothetical protein JCM16418_252 [Paenibacillus pini JCM 16418]
MTVKQLLFIGIGLVLLYGLFTVGAPFLLAAIIAISLEPINGLFIHKLGWKRVTAASLTSTLFLLLVVVLVYLLGLQMFEQFLEFWKSAPYYFSTANEFVQNTVVQAHGAFDRLHPDLADGLRGLFSNLTSYTVSLINSLSSTFLSFAKGLPSLFVFFMVFFVAVYLMSYSLETMRSTFLSFFREGARSQIDEVLVSLKKSVFGFLQAQIILSAFTYVVTLSGLLILHIHYPLAIAMLTMVVDILPVLGVGMVFIPWALYLFIVGDTYTALGLVLLFIFITVARRIIEPKIVANSVGIDALSALVSMYVGFKVVGMIGFLVGPMVVIIYAALRRAGLFQFRL